MTTSKNNKALFGIFAMVFVFFVILIAFSSLTMNAFNETSSNQSSSNANAPIAVITVEGAIMESKTVIELLQIAEEDKKVKAIILRIDSPGGAVGPTQEIYEEIQRIDVAKPIYASFGGVAASGGYYLGAATRKIWSNPGTITGSIGVIMQFMDLSKLYEFAKVSPQTVKAGRYKDAGNPNRALTEEESAMMNKMIEGVHKQFINDILKRRAERIKGDINDHAQGQIFSGEEAYSLGLVDELGGLWTAGRAIHQELNFQEKFGLKFIEKKKKMSFMELMGSMEESIGRFKPESLLQLDNSTPQLFYK